LLKINVFFRRWIVNGGNSRFVREVINSDINTDIAFFGDIFVRNGDGIEAFL